MQHCSPPHVTAPSRWVDLRAALHARLHAAREWERRRGGALSSPWDVREEPEQAVGSNWLRGREGTPAQASAARSVASASGGAASRGGETRRAAAATAAARCSGARQRFTTSVRPSRLSPSKARAASSAACVSNVTNAMPRKRPVSGKVSSVRCSMEPQSDHTARTSASPYQKGMPPT